MGGSKRRVSPARFVQCAELLDAAFPAPPATPDYLAHECELAEGALSAAAVTTAVTRDDLLAQLLNLKLSGTEID